MGFKESVQKQVRAAFKAVGNLAVDVVLTKKNSTGFDFTTSIASSTVNATLAIKGVLVSKKSKSTGETATVIRNELILISEDVAAFTDFDSLTINGEAYSPRLPYDDNGYTLTVVVTRTK
jgi:hypothetical protein